MKKENNNKQQEKNPIKHEKKIKEMKLHLIDRETRKNHITV